MVQAYADYMEMLELTEEMIRAAATAVTGGLKVLPPLIHLHLRRVRICSSEPLTSAQAPTSIRRSSCIKF